MPIELSTKVDFLREYKKKVNLRIIKGIEERLIQLNKELKVAKEIQR